MVQWISTKLDTQVILTKIWHPIDFLGQRSRSQLTFEFFRGLTAREFATLVDSSVFTRNVTEGRTDARKDSSVTFVGEGITMYKVWSKSIEGC
jgi:hypothetical protein